LRLLTGICSALAISGTVSRSFAKASQRARTASRSDAALAAKSLIAWTAEIRTQQ